ncbi:MAG TPA: hypothetical protein VGI74_05105 [Streptosporangiaceae bacterium]|jgi:hypothetical protein
MHGSADRVAGLGGRPLAPGGPRVPGRSQQVTERRDRPASANRPPLLSLRRRTWVALSLKGAGPVIRRNRDERLLWALNKATTPDRRACLPIHIWRWRYELILAAGLGFVATIVLRTLGLAWGTVVLSAMLGVCSPPWPPWLTYCGWHVITPHRVRVGLTRARIHNRSGWHPLVIKVTCEEFGERVVLWCPAGTTAEEVYRARAILRAACWAADVRVSCDVLRSHVVTVDVIRRGDGISRVNRGGPDSIAQWPLDEPGPYERAAVSR